MQSDAALVAKPNLHGVPSTRLSRGISCIDILLVASTLVILSGLLYPLIANASEAAAKNGTSENYKKVCTATLLYAGEYNDCLPLAAVPDSSKDRWRWSADASIPAGWSGDSFAQEPRISEDRVHWANSVQAYLNTYAPYAAEGLPLVSPRQPGLSSFGAATASICFNGLLHTYSLSGINNPQSVPLYWSGRGRQQVLGFATSNPVLRCTGQGPCKFSPGKPPQTGVRAAHLGAALIPMASAWTYGKGLHFVQVDGSASFRKVEVTDENGAVTAAEDIFKEVHPGGVPNSLSECASPRELTSYPCFFRPDRDRERGMIDERRSSPAAEEGLESSAL